MDPLIIKKLRNSYHLKRIFYERLTAPLHLNIISIFIYIFGTYKQKIEFDLIIRQQHAYGLLKAGERAIKMGLKSITVIEFGVGNGVGLINLEKIAKRLEKELNIKYKIVGFDTGVGMPKAIDYKDHPNLYFEGDFPMDPNLLRSKLDKNTEFFLGDIDTTIASFIENLSNEEPIGFVSIDVDYYSSTKKLLPIFLSKQSKYLDIVEIYIDDIEHESHNSFCGELLAINEFNTENELRKIERHQFLTNKRIFKDANWIKHMYQLHVLDCPSRSDINQKREKPLSLYNPYL